ncbi:tripartite tricarboxylate transporter TctB family protein [Granulosicoccus antarcticus]|uniref:DUF1468 domain-containing protein n=1 Tax=Granulosicoccus antarcticus IMCC3135 TaxID=1192854 RepID=A0A2Z2NQN4_9GAMM|nr:tripartite tricarboxylate transporter TctB family protein [Granulosicoccus antarcticus]ASJ73786.1 hypothetical protein IMCC3135_18535 [Granulosicoccus antarcticus IMCC3135]
MSVRYRESILVAISLVTAILVYWSADQIPSSLMAKISAGLVPKMIATSLALIACLHLLLIFKNRSEDADDVGDSPVSAGSDEGISEGGVFSLWRMVTSAVLLGLFILCLDQEWLSFWWAGCLFTAFGILLLSELSVRAVLMAVTVSLVSVSLAVLLFTRVFTVILP